MEKRGAYELISVFDSLALAAWASHVPKRLECAASRRFRSVLAASESKVPERGALQTLRNNLCGSAHSVENRDRFEPGAGVAFSAS